MSVRVMTGTVGRGRTGGRLLAVAVALGVLAAACGGGGGDDDEGKGTSSSETTTTAPTTTTTAPNSFPVPPGEEVAVRPDGFTVTKVPVGQKPPQFVVVSFDGGGWHEKWEYWRALQDEVPFHFTAFLSGTYLLSEANKELYTGPGHDPGASSIGWAAPEDVPVVIEDINEALARGDEIGTHFNGHFCSGSEPSGMTWTTEQWNSELDQFFSFITDVQANNGIDDTLDLVPEDVIGARTQCLEGDPDVTFPALAQHGILYDSSVPRTGLSWPVKSDPEGIWELGMGTFPMNGTDRMTITMDYNFYYRQREAVSEGVTPEESAADSEQVLNTYRDMYHATFDGNRAPLLLGNHFNEWNNGAYQNAVANFVRETCVKPETYCVTFEDLITWMDAQDPAVLQQLQALPAEMAPRP